MRPAVIAGGSSPLTRGKLKGAGEAALDGGLIPAHAGKTSSLSASRSRPWAHPRSRGENLAEQGWDTYALGSSPLTRGKRRDGEPRIREGRLIPAHAGKTPRTSRRQRRSRAHPRSRGENLEERSDSCEEGGSSPLTRGKRGEDRRDGHPGRLIPAHAGKTPTAPEIVAVTWAHPRSRGENRNRHRPSYFLDGSSPLTRGKPVDAGLPRGGAGLIPAHAGKTRFNGRGVGHIGAHPRSRGENESRSRAGLMTKGSSPLTRGKQTSRMASLASLGSSPLTRGKLAVVLGSAHRRGLIPAHAGKTMRLLWSLRSFTAHPRSRGENTETGSWALGSTGSSPLTRGKHSQRDQGRLARRLIPAHAGKTQPW